ncbi:MAG TPA: DMT family transporter [Chloroflexota bacterium]|jgi:drug/metabolite transporter (DMT)-like permease
MPPSRLQLYSAMLTATFFWGSLPVAAKALVGVVGPIQQALVRGASGFVVLTLFCLLVGGTRPLRAALTRPLDVVVQGFLAFFASSLAALLTLQFTTASMQSVLVATFPLMLAVFELRGGGVTARGVAGMLIALVGIVAVVGGDDPRQIVGGGGDLRGVGLGLLTALIIACSQSFARRNAVAGGDPLGTTAMAAAAAMPMLVATVLLFGDPGELVRAPPEARPLLVYIGVFCTAINFGLWYWALKYVSAARAAPLQYLTTPLSVVLAWYFLGEPLTVGLAVGTALVVAGVTLTQGGRGAARIARKSAEEATA